MTVSKPKSQLPYTYLSLLHYCIGRFLKADFQEYIVKWRPKENPKALQRMKLGELRDLFLSVVTETRARSLYRKHPEKFGFYREDIERFLHISLDIGQLEYLEREGKIRTAVKFTGKETPEELTEPRAYRPEDVVALTPEDRKVPSIRHYQTQTAVISEYGGTKSLINKLLPPPILKQNPKYKSGAPVKLWHIDDIEAAMKTEEWKKKGEKAEQRQLAAERAVQTKRDKTFAMIEKAIQRISVEVLPDDELRQATWNQKANWEFEKGNFEFVWDADIHSINEDTFQRWIVNFIRHNLTDYDYDLYRTAGKVGCREAYYEYRVAVLDKIAEAYPCYKQECERQKLKI